MQMEINAKNPMFVAAINDAIEHRENLKRKEREESIQRAIEGALRELESRIQNGRWEKRDDGLLQTTLIFGDAMRFYHDAFDQERLRAIQTGLRVEGFGQQGICHVVFHLVVTIPPPSAGN